MRRRFALVLAARGKKKNAISQPWRMQVIGKSLTCIKIAVVGRKYGHSVKNYASLTRPILIDLALPARSTDEFSQNSYARYSKRTRTKHQQKKKTRKKKKTTGSAKARSICNAVSSSARHRKSPRGPPESPAQAVTLRSILSWLVISRQTSVEASGATQWVGG